MKKILQIIFAALGSVTVVVAGAVGYAAVTGQFSDDPIQIESLSFTESNFLVIDDFNMNFSYEPMEANELDITLRVVRGNSAVSVPSTVKANQPFTIELLKDEDGNNIGGEVEITASSGLAVVTENLKFWIDIAIPQEGLMIATDAPADILTAGGDAFHVYVFTDPRLALYPDSRMNEELLLDYAFKDINIATSNAGALEIVNGTGIDIVGYYNPNYATNGGDIFTDSKTTNNTIETRAKVFTVKPVSDDGGTVTVSAQALRTYGMEEDFIDIDDPIYTTSEEAYRAFSNYVDKYKSYIEADTRTFTKESTTYENGAAFLEAVLQSGKVYIPGDGSGDTKYEAAMFYLYVATSQEFEIQNVKISGLTATTSTVTIPLFETWQLNREELVSTFGINLTATDASFTQDMRLAKLGSVEISAYKGIDADENGELDQGVDLDLNGVIEGDELNELILVPATDEFLITNPENQINYDPTNPIWTIQSLNPQETTTDGLRLRFSITEESDLYYADVAMSVNLNEPGMLTMTLPENFEMTINPNLNASMSEVQTYAITSNNYTIENANPSYHVVKFFVTANSATNLNGYQVLRLSADYSATQLSMPHMHVDDVVDAYEITYNDGLNILLNAINVQDNNNGLVSVFAAIIKTDYLGEPLLDEDNNYIIVEKSNFVEFGVTAYIEQLNFYTVNPDTGAYTKRSAENDTETVTLLSNNSYTFYVTNAELTSTGEFDQTNVLYGNSEHIAYQNNLLYALKKDAYGTETDPKENIEFIKSLFSVVGDEDVLQIEPGDGRATYTYNTSTNLIEVNINVVPRAVLLNTYTDSTLPSFQFNLYAQYKGTTIPLNLQTESTIGVNVVFASLTDDVIIHNTSNITSGVITVEATATQGNVQWLYNDNGSRDLFDITSVEYGYDITSATDGVYTSSKIDVSFNTPQFVEGYYKEVPLGQGDYLQDEPSYTYVGENNGNYTESEGVYTLIGDGQGDYVLNPTTYSYVGEANGNYEFKDGYLQKLQNDFTFISWESDKPEFLSITYDTSGVPSLNIHKGTSTGELVTITVILETYPDDNSNYLQRQTKTLQVLLKQDSPEAYLYSLNTLPNIGEHLIVNSSAYAFQMAGGSTYDLLQNQEDGLGDPLSIYAYDTETEETPIDTGVTSNILIDVRFPDSHASIIGDLTFTVQQASQSTPTIYFKTDPNSEEKLYTTKAALVTEESNSYYVLQLYSENIATDSIQTIIITDSFGNIYYYNVFVSSNIEVTKPENTNITTNDTTSVDLNDYYAINQTLNVNGVDTILRLPITFELADTTSAYFADIEEYVNSGAGVYSVGDATGDEMFVLNSTEVGNYATQTRVNTSLIPFRVSEQKSLRIKLYYYVPKLESDGTFVYVTDEGNLLHYSETLTAYATWNNEHSDEIQYEGLKYYVFEMREFTYSELDAILVNPTNIVAKGSDLIEPIEILSGTEQDLFVVNGNSATPTTTNFMDVENATTQSLVLPAGVVINTLDNNSFDYSNVYESYFVLTPNTAGFTTEQQEIYISLGLQLTDGVIATNSINADLVVPFKVWLLEGELLGGIPSRQVESSIVINIKFLNSVEFSVNNISVEGAGYDTGENTETTFEIGHTYADINQVQDIAGQNTIVVQEVSQTLYDRTNLPNENILQMVGGQNEDLMYANVASVTLQQYVNGVFVDYSSANPAVGIITSITNDEINSITLMLYGAVNADSYFRVVIEASTFDLTGYYYFTLESEVSLIATYPHYDGYEAVTKNVTVNLHDNYIEENPRIQIAYGENIYELQTVLDIITLVNVENASDTIEVVNSGGSSSLGINYFTYQLLDSSKTVLTSAEEVDGAFPRVATSYNNGYIVFNSNITSFATYYIRISLFNGAYLDYRFELYPSIITESISVHDEYNVAYTENNPMPVTANTTTNLFDAIDLQNGLTSNLLVKYLGYDTLAVTMNGLAQEMSANSYLPYGETITFDDVNANTLVSFAIYGANFVSGMQPIILYVRVQPNFNATNQVNNVAAGISNLLVNNGSNGGIFNLSGDASDNVIFEVLTINGVAYTTGNEYGVEITGTELADFSLVSNNLASSITLQISITKNFDSGVVYSITKTVVIVPNLTISPNYETGYSYYEVTAPAMDAETASTMNMFNVLTFEDYAGNEITISGNEDVEVLFTLVDEFGNSLGTSTTGISGFNATTGDFTLEPVNNTAYAYILVSFTWVDDSVSFETTYYLVIQPNLNDVSITYSDAVNNSLTVYAGVTLQLDFSQDSTFVELDEETITISADQYDDATLENVNIVLLETENSEYKLYEDTGNYYITFYQVSSTMQTITIPVYVDLTGDYIGVKNVVASVLYSTGRYLNFHLYPSVASASLNPTYSAIQNSGTPLTVDYADPTFTAVTPDTALYDYNATDGYTYEGVGAGDYDLTYENLRYTYVGVNKGSYDPFSVGTNDYDMLGISQYDLFSMFTLNLNSGLLLNSGTNGIVVLEEYIRNSLVYVVSNSNYVKVSNGIATFMPDITLQTVSISVYLYSTSTAPIATLYFEIPASGMLASVATEGEENSTTNRYVVDDTETINLYDKIVYGYVLNTYTTSGVAVSDEISVLSDDVTVVNRKVNENADTQTVIVVNIDKTLVSLVVITGTSVAQIENGVLIFDSTAITDTINVLVSFSVAGFVETMYFTVNDVA